MAKRKSLTQRQKELETEIKKRGVHLGYEKLQFAGLRLKSGLCLFKGRYHLYIDRYKTTPAKVEMLQSALAELEELESNGGTLFDLAGEPRPEEAAEPQEPETAETPQTDQTGPEQPAPAAETSEQGGSLATGSEAEQKPPAPSAAPADQRAQ